MESDCCNKLFDIIALLHFYIILIIAIGGPTYLLWILFPNVFYIFVFWAVIMGFLVITIPHYGKKAKQLVRKYPEFMSNLNHHAIIVAHSEKRMYDCEYPYKNYNCGVDLLILAFRAHTPPKPYKVYDVEKISDVVDIINNPKTQYLWIFGHGRRNKLKLSDGFLCYYHVRTAPSKYFIGQYHCNSPLGKSLVDYLNPRYSDVTSTIRFSLTARISIENKLRELNLM